MAQTLKRLMEQQGGVQIEVISVEELLKEPPKPAKPAGHSSALDAAESGEHGGGGGGHWLATFRIIAALGLTHAFGDDAQPQEPAAAKPQPAVTIAVDPSTNSLVVVGSPRMTDRLATLAAQLEKQMPAEPAKVHICALPQGSDAGALANLIRQTVQQLGRVGPGNSGGFTGQVTVAPDPADSALIIWANDTDFASVTDLIRAVSSLDPGAEMTIKVIPLATVTASRAIQAVNDLVSSRPQGRQAQRYRGSLELTVQERDGSTITARLDPALIRLTADPNGASVIVAAPASTVPIIERFISLIDQSPVGERLAIRRYDLTNARAQDLSQTLQTLFEAQRQGPGRDELPQARFIPDARTNSLLVTASELQHGEVARLLETMDAGLDDSGLTLEIIALQNATPSAMQRTIEQVVIGRNPALKDRVQVSAQDGSSLLVVRAPAEQIAEIKKIVAQIDTADTGGLPIRFVKLEQADAQGVAAALQKFFQDRATVSSRTGQRVISRVAIVGDRRSGSLIVSCNDDDFEQLQSLVKTFDVPAKARAMQVQIIPLQNTSVSDIADTVQNIAMELQWERTGGIFWSPWGGGSNRGADAPPEDKLFVETNERTNSVVLMGQGETMETMKKIIAELDRPASDQTKVVVKAVSVERGDLNTIANMVRQVTLTPGWRTWRGPDPDAVAAHVDTGRRLIFLVGKAPRVELAATYVAEMKGSAGRPDAVFEPISLEHAQAPRAAETLRRVFQERAESEGLPPDAVSIIGSADGNLLIVTADPESMKVAKDLIGLIDQPEMGKDRQIEVYTVRNREADEIASMVRAQFPRGRGRPETQVIVTPQPSTNSIVVSAQQADLPQIKSLIAQLDSPVGTELGSVVTVPLKTARADEVANALRTALPDGLKVKITPIRRNNTLLVSGSDENIQAVLAQIKQIDIDVDRPLVELRRVQLRHALAFDVYWTIDSMLRARPRSTGEPEPTVDYSRTENTLTYSGTPDQLRDMDKMIEALDVPTVVSRKTEFVKLEFARAEQTAKALEVFYGRAATAATTPAARNVAIVPDPASNSLVISAEDGEWEGLRSLLKKLDTEEYDTSRQLAVIPLKHADAASVARALNEGFRAPVESRIRREQAARQNQPQRGNRRDQEDLDEPLVLVDNEPTPSVSAEPQTNSLVVFAGRQDMVRIRALVEQIDIPDFVKFAEPRVLPLSTGKASQIAEAVREIYTGEQRGSNRNQGPRSVVIVGDDASNCLIIRAEERDYAQIAALAEALQQQGDKARATVRVLPLRNVPAARLQKTIAATFTQAARQQNEVLSVEVDRTSNALVIASSGRLFDEIEKVVKELDGLIPAAEPGAAQIGAPGLGQTIFIIDVKNNAPEDVRRQLEQLGVTRPPADDRPGVVSEPVTIVPLSSRRALAIVASPGDGESVVALVRALDAEPAYAEQKVCIVGLKLASASAVVNTLKSMLNPAEQSAQTGPAKAIAEQVRRLSVASNSLDKDDLQLDLSHPIRLIADDSTNSILVASTQANMTAVCEIIKTLDALPIGDAVIVRIFPLNNASASRAKTVIDDLFRQGEQLRRLPGTARTGLPTTTTGKALAGELAATVDDRTNTLIVAGPEDAVALVEVLLKDLDGDRTANWVEPSLIPLKHADASRIAQMLRQVLVQGLPASPEATGLQKQIGRLRMVKSGRDLNDPAARIEADLFAPLSGLVIAPESSLNALIVLGSPANTAIVRELVAMLDVEAASAANTVRLFPLRYAAADRVQAIVQDVFRQRQQDPAARDEDRLIISSDIRTNSLIVSTSAGSFSILDAMLKTLDSEQSNATVGLHVVPVVGADATALAPRILRLMTERISASQRSGAIKSPTDAFSLEADAASNLLIVACSDENLALVRELVKTLGEGNPSATAAITDIVQVRSGRAGDAATMVNQMYADRENARRGANSVSVMPNERLNALVVTGTEEDVAQVRRILDRLESAGVAIEQDIRRVGLRSANALEVVNLLQNVLAGRSVSGANDIAARQATNIRFFRDQVARSVEERLGEVPTEAQIDGAIREQVTLTADLRTNSVMIKAPPQIMEVVMAMIEDLDTTSAGARRIAKFTLKNADVRAMAELLRDVFTLRQQGSKYVLVPTSMQPLMPDGTEPQGPPTSLTPVPDERQELSIAIDARTNTLIVSGTEEYLERVSEIVEDLDNIQAQERSREVYAVRNTKAKDLELTLQTYFRGEAQMQRALLGPDQSGSVMRQLEQEVTVVGDELSNKLVISASPRYIDMVMSMVEELDSAPPQVVIQVLLAEVTLDNNATWGADLKLRNIGGQNMSIASLAAGAGVAAALGVPNLTFAATDFDLILRALEAQGKLQVLSRPYVSVRNNVQASIQVGDNIGVVEGAMERTPQGGTVANVQRKDIGIILNVTPSISPDGFVSMDIIPEISSLSTRTTQITADLNAPIITQRKVNTNVTVKDGQTVVIGGLIQTQQEDRRSKTPFIGDIPLVGWLFRSKQELEVKTELLVILTPRVIYNDAPEGVDKMRDISRHKIEFLENPRDVQDAILHDLPPNGELPWRVLDEQPALPAPVEPKPEPPASDSETYAPARKSAPKAPKPQSPPDRRWKW
jgi:type II secretion system protein D